MADIFELATRKKLRFPTSIGLLSTEQLWDLPLVAKGERPNLDALARATSKELKELGEESFVEMKPDPRKADLALGLDILKRVIAVKLDEQKAAEKRAENVARKKLLMGVLAEKEVEGLKSMSREDIAKELEKLGE